MSRVEKPFMLLDYQVPECPASTLWSDQLRWLICVMNPDDGSLHYIASVLAYALKNDCLTDRQSKAANKILRRVRLDFAAGVLDCQLNEDVTDNLDKSLADMDIKGSVQ